MAVSGQPTVKTLKAALTTVQPITAADRAGDGQPSAERATVSCCWPVQSPGSQGRAVGRYSPLAPRVVLLAGTVPWLPGSCCWPVQSPGSQDRAVGRYSPLVHRVVLLAGTVPWLTGSCCWPVQSPGSQQNVVLLAGTVPWLTAKCRAVGRYSPLAHSKVSCCWPVQSPGSQQSVVLLAGTVPWLTGSCCRPVQSPGSQGRAVGRYSPLAYSKVAEVGLQLILFRTGPFRPHLQGHGS